jgi:hypothetical protein
VRGHGEKLTRKQDLAIAALLLHPTIGDAAKAAGVDESTLWRWLKLPGFRAAYQAARAEAVSQAIARLQHASGVAVTTLVRVMADQKAPASAKVAAAKTVLETAVRGTELSELQRRVTELERDQDAPDIAGEEGENPIVSDA